MLQTVRVDDADPPAGTETDVGLTVEVGPVGETLEVSVTGPLKPLTLFTLIWDDPQFP